MIVYITEKFKLDEELESILIQIRIKLTKINCIYQQIIS